MTAIPLSRADVRDIFENVVEAFRRHQLNVAAAAIAYRLLIAAIPFALFALALVGFLNLDTLWAQHVGPWVAGRTSKPLFEVLNDTVTQVLGHKQGFWVTIGLLLTLWEISSAVRVTMDALDRVYEVRTRRPWRLRMLVSVALAAVVGVVGLGAIAVLAVGGGGLDLLWRVPVAAALLGAAVWVVVRWGPSKRRPVRWVSFGTGTTVAAWLVMAGGYALWVTQISSPGSAFGSLTAVFVLAVFVYVSAMAFLVGVVIDASVREEATGGTA